MIERIKCSDAAMMTKPSEHGAMAMLMVAAARMSGMSTSAVPRSAMSVFDVDENTIFSSNIFAWVRSDLVKTFADQLLALLPKRPRALRIQGVGLHAHAQAGGRCGLGDVAVFAVSTADRLGVGHASGPDRSCRALGNALIAEGRSTFGLTGVDLRNQLVQHIARQVPAELSSDPPGVHGRRSHPTRFVTAVELDCKQHIGGLGPAVGSEFGIGCVLEVRIFQIDVRISVAR